jgi:hypothetical protein
VRGDATGRDASTRPCDATQHAAGANGAAEGVERTVGLFQEFASDAGVSVDRIRVVELIGPERVRLGREPGDLFLESFEQRGVTLPPSLGTSRSSAPNARIVRSFSSAKASDDTRTQR